ncbi:MAG: hypothetical protein ABJN62_15685 [Halioglobus sp.]
MPKIPEDTEPKNWHRFFAMEANNLAWELAVQARSSEQNQEMLDAAHTAAFHWNAVGTTLNKMRAKMLLAEVHALMGLGVSALNYAEQVREYFLSQQSPDWEVAFVHTIHAHAASAAGNQEEFIGSYEAAKIAIAKIEDEEDRNIVLKTFNNIPSP